MRDFESLNVDRRRKYIAEARDAATSLCASAFQTAVTATPARKKVTAVWQDKNGQQYKSLATSSDAAEEDSETQIPEVFDDGDSALAAARSKLDGGAPGVDPEIALRDLVAEVRDIEVSLQDLAPSVKLAERVESRLRELFTTDLRQPSARKRIRKTPHENPESLLKNGTVWKTQVTKRVASEVLGLSERMIRNLIEEGKLKTQGEGYRGMITVPSIRARVKGQRKPA
jgi:hypothetical protein